MNFETEMEIYFSSTKLQESKQCFLRNDETIRKFLELESDILRDRSDTSIEAVLGSMSVKIVESLS